jgi:hypothetical protein
MTAAIKAVSARKRVRPSISTLNVLVFAPTWVAFLELQGGEHLAQGSSGRRIR